MRTLALLVVLAACEEHGSSQCPGTSPCLDAGFPDSGGTNPACADDSPLEPNDTPQTAAAVPLMGAPFTLAGLAICPAGDRDHFAVEVPANVGLALTTTSEGAQLFVSLLDGGGAEVASGVIIGNETKLCAPNLPGGPFVVRVTSLGVATIYRLSIEAVAVCP